ncbi:hypothetical protein [Bacillus toyonensis]
MQLIYVLGETQDRKRLITASE